MGEEEAASADLERSCQGISHGVAVCTYPATVRCPTCKKWFVMPMLRTSNGIRACCQCLINAVTVQVKSALISLSCNATNQDLSKPECPNEPLTQNNFRFARYSGVADCQRELRFLLSAGRRSAHFRMASSVGQRDWPHDVRRYSTFGGTWA